jgi:hypothetical protein
MSNLHIRWENANKLSKKALRRLQKDLIKAGFISEEEINTKWECNIK